MAPLVNLQPGSTFADDFRVVGLLATGGMGAVYVVEQRSTGKQRAMKVMDPALVAVPEHRARFEAEARMAARIESDHVVEVVAAGIDEASQTPWLAMELLKGETLGARLARGRLEPAEAVEVLRQVAHALGAAHRAGLVHRDIKPDNVFLATSRRDGERSVVKVLDFGIAKVLQDARARSVATAPIGTPLWMAPEQTEARGLIGPQTDVWAFGLLAFVVLTGRCYWLAANEAELSIPAVMREALFTPMPAASARAAELGAPGTLPEGFDAWFAGATTRDAAHRFAHADAALSALLPLFRVPVRTSLGAPAVPPQQPTQPMVARTVAWSAVPAAAAAAAPGSGSSRGWLPWAVGAVLLASAAAAVAVHRTSGSGTVDPPAAAAPSAPAAPSTPAANGATAPLPPIAPTPNPVPEAPLAAHHLPPHHPLAHAAVPSSPSSPTATDAGSGAPPTAAPATAPSVPAAAPTAPSAATPVSAQPGTAAPQPLGFGDGGLAPFFRRVPNGLPGLLNPNVRPIPPGAAGLPQAAPTTAPVAPPP